MDDHLPTLDRIEPTRPGRLRPVGPGVWATPDEPLGGPANTCGFLIRRPEGNAFIYSCNAIVDYFDHLDELGGVDMVLLNHRDEATRHVTTLAVHYDIPVHVHRLEVEACTERGVERIEPLDSDTELGADLRAWHTPGHTPGTTSYAWTDPTDANTYLFTGDTFTNFTIDHFPAVLGFHAYPGNTDDMYDTLERIRDLPTDIVVPGLANGVINAYTWTVEQRHRLIDHARSQLTDREPNRT